MESFIFLKGFSEKTNCHAGFRKDIQLQALPAKAVLTITARSFYRLYVNGVFVSHGPARSGHGHLRLDEVDITGQLTVGINRIAVEVTSYGNAYGYSNDITCESGLLCCRLDLDGKNVFRTDDSWKGIRLVHKRDQADRYSHCRQISELYDLDGTFFNWRTSELDQIKWDEVEKLDTQVVLLPRGMDYPRFDEYRQIRLIGAGSVYPKENATEPLKFYERPMEEAVKKLPERPSTQCKLEGEAALKNPVRFTSQGVRVDGRNAESSGTYLFYDAGRMLTGFIGVELVAESDLTLDIIHGERMEEDGSLDPRPQSNNVIRLHCKKGNIPFLSFEPYVMRYLKIIVRGGTALISKVSVRSYTFPDTGTGSFFCSDESLNRIFEAARLTLQLNTLDIFMDCPDRERGGWLCDSFWTGRAQRMLFGDTRVEKAMLENFLHLPDEEHFHGLFPCVYPGVSKLPNGDTIITWSFWLILELAEYYRRTGDREFIESYRTRLEKLFQGVRDFENKAGLLENVPCSVFIDWSMSNNREYTHPISVPCNALYASCLEEMGKLYNREDWTKKASEVRQVLRKYALISGGYVERQVLVDSLEMSEQESALKARNYYSEAGHYTSIWSQLVKREDSPELFDDLVWAYGPCAVRKPEQLDVVPANMFIGLCVRMDMLAKLGEYSRLLEEIRTLYSGMLDEGPGTLWETLSGKSSRCHGFNAHAGVWLTRDILGLGIPDEIDRTIRIAPHPCGLKWARGMVKVGEEMASLFWNCGSREFNLSASVPEGYKAILEIPALPGYVMLNGHPVEAGIRSILCEDREINLKIVL